MGSTSSDYEETSEDATDTQGDSDSSWVPSPTRRPDTGSLGGRSQVVRSQEKKRKWGKIPLEVQPVRDMVLRGRCITWIPSTKTKGKAQSGRRRQVIMEEGTTVRSPRRKKAKLMEVMNKLDHGVTMHGAESANGHTSNTTSFSEVVRAQVHGTCGPGF